MLKPLIVSGTVYILTNKNHTVLYVGVTSNLQIRMEQHLTKFYNDSFTAKYNVNKLVYYRNFETIESAIVEEKRIKGGNRQQKINLINSINSNWDDLWLIDFSKW